MKYPLLTALILLSSLAHAQGMLPGMKDEPAKPAEPAPSYVLLGNSVPEKLNVITDEGHTRALLSFKPANDYLVVGFYSSRCPKNQERWNQIRRLYQDFKGWHVTFIGVSVEPGENLEDLERLMKKQGISMTVVRDEEAKTAHALHAQAIPQMVIINEYGYLKFRGELKDARKALEELVGYEDLTVDPEPQNIEGCPIP